MKDFKPQPESGDSSKEGGLQRQKCCPGSNGGGGSCSGSPAGLARRDFLRLLGISGAASLAGGGLLLTPGQAVASDFDYPLIPADKKLDPAWLQSLFARGSRTVATGADLDRIGMPVGGIFCGQLYLSGDGRLWHWDVFNSPASTMVAAIFGEHYVTPFDSTQTTVKQGFALKIGSGSSARFRQLDRHGFANVSFKGQYPIGVIEYGDPTSPVAVQLEAFSPFIPLNADDSGIPATIMEFRIRNVTDAPVDVEIAGWLQNSVCRFTPNVVGMARNQVTRDTNHSGVVGSVTSDTASGQVSYEDFERGSYAPWVTSGTAFGDGPVDLTNYPSSRYQQITGGHGRYVVNSHASAPPKIPSGDDAADSSQRDLATGTLTGPTFTLEHDLVHFLICGGNHPGECCFNLCRGSDSVVLATATGANTNALSEQTWNVSRWKGQQVYFQIVDRVSGIWGNIGVDHIRFENQQRPDVVFDDFERATYAPWVASGSAFGGGPVNVTNLPAYQVPSTIGQHGQFLVNSHASAPGADVGVKDRATGILTSPGFVISRRYINFLIGGGSHAGIACMNLVVEGQIVRTATGSDNNQLHPFSWNVFEYEGRTAQLQIVDNDSGGWGNVGVDNIVFSDTPTGGIVDPDGAPDQGTMCIALLKPQEGDRVSNDAHVESLQNLFADLSANSVADVARPLPGELVGACSRRATIPGRQEAVVTFVITWHFPKTDNNHAGVVNGGWGAIQGIGALRRYYANRFADAGGVAKYVADNHDRLASKTRLWRDTWYDSTLPYWFLDRTFANTSALATATAHRFSNGRFWGWEGAYCCAGTCTHVWQYAQAMGRIFPEIERDQRQRVDLGLGFDAATGLIHVRAENLAGAAVDGQAGTILRCYREHQMSPDSTFLATNWPNIKRSMNWLIAQKDGNMDGILEGAQGNTLDLDWYGKSPWLSSLYIAACRACAQMALEMGDAVFATTLEAIARAGADYMHANLFHNSEYFVQKAESSGMNVGSGWGCEIDQVFGQSWAFQVGLGRLLDRSRTLSALERLWKYNFAPDAGGFRLNPDNPVRGGRSYAMAGEAGLVMASFPDPEHPVPLGVGWTEMYFNECMSGFEHEVASHMIWEGMVLEGLAITRAVHDRYAPSKRNPYNEVECGDHYARSMASYGTYIAACGYEYHGPKTYIAFSPRISPEDFKSAFTVAEGWGTFSQRRSSTMQSHIITIKHGRLNVKALAFDVRQGTGVPSLSVKLEGLPVAATMDRSGDRITVRLTVLQTILENQSLLVDLDLSPFTILGGGQGGSGFEVTWASIPGRHYSVEYSDVMPAVTWVTLATHVPSSATDVTGYRDNTTVTAKRFYRIKLEP